MSEPAPEPTKPAILLDVLTLTGSDESAAAGQLGAPDECEGVSPSGVGAARKCTYWGGNVEVVFIGGQADWITVYGADAPSPEHPHLGGRASPEVLQLLGLSSDGRPTEGPIGLFFNGGVESIREVSLFKVSMSDDTLSYAYIKGTTP